MLNLKRLQMGKKRLWTVHRLNQETITKQTWVPENVKATLPGQAGVSRCSSANHVL